MHASTQSYISVMYGMHEKKGARADRKCDWKVQTDALVKCMQVHWWKTIDNTTDSECIVAIVQDMNFSADETDTVLLQLSDLPCDEIKWVEISDGNLSTIVPVEFEMYYCIPELAPGTFPLPKTNKFT